MLDIASYAKQEGIPYEYWLADSWWYYRDPDAVSYTHLTLPTILLV